MRQRGGARDDQAARGARGGARPLGAERRDLHPPPLRGGALQHRVLPRPCEPDDHPRRLLQDVCYDGVAHRLRRHAGRACAPLLEAEHQQRLVHGFGHPDGGGRGAAGSAGAHL